MHRYDAIDALLKIELKSEMRPRHHYHLQLVLGHLATLDCAEDELDRRRSREKKTCSSRQIKGVHADQKTASALTTPTCQQDNAIHGKNLPISLDLSVDADRRQQSKE